LPVHSLGVGTERIGIHMSQTSKDSARNSTQRIVLEVATNDDGTYEITVNAEVVETYFRKMARRRALRKTRILRQELAEIKRQLRESGKAVLTV
jgi:GrpB-like predicted nucleotidyltransferase (UPF0157 family)